MVKIINTETRKKIIARDGVKDILLHFSEEIGELLAIINQRKRGKCNKSDVEKEIADVIVCLEFVKEILGLEDGLIDLKISNIIHDIKKEVSLLSSHD